MEYKFEELVELYKYVQIQMVLKHVKLETKELVLLKKEEAEIAEKYGIPYEKTVITEDNETSKLDDETLASFVARMENTLTSWQTEERKKYIQETVIAISELKKLPKGNEKDEQKAANALAGYLFSQLSDVKDTYDKNDLNTVVKNSKSPAFRSAYFEGLAMMLTSKTVEDEIEVQVGEESQKKVVKKRETVEIEPKFIREKATASHLFLLHNFNKGRVDKGLKEESPFNFEGSKIFTIMKFLSKLIKESLDGDLELGEIATAKQKVEKLAAEKLAAEKLAQEEVERLAAEKLAKEETLRLTAEPAPKSSEEKSETSGWRNLYGFWGGTKANVVGTTGAKPDGMMFERQPVDLEGDKPIVDLPKPGLGDSQIIVKPEGELTIELGGSSVEVVAPGDIQQDIEPEETSMRM